MDKEIMEKEIHVLAKLTDKLERNDNHFFNLLEVLLQKGMLNQKDLEYIRYHNVKCEDAKNTLSSDKE